MPAVAVQISRFVDEHQPGFVECVLLDADGRTHLFVEKVPIVSQLDLRANSEYPCAGAIDCELVSEWQDEFGRLLARVNIDCPWHVESTSGEAQFVVLKSQILR